MSVLNELENYLKESKWNVAHSPLMKTEIYGVLNSYKNGGNVSYDENVATVKYILVDKDEDIKEAKNNFDKLIQKLKDNKVQIEDSWFEDKPKGDNIYAGFILK
jgi:hypothetical protein